MGASFSTKSGPLNRNKSRIVIVQTYLFRIMSYLLPLFFYSKTKNKDFLPFSAKRSHIAYQYGLRMWGPNRNCPKFYKHSEPIKLSAIINSRARICVCVCLCLSVFCTLKAQASRDAMYRLHYLEIPNDVRSIVY